MNHLSIFGTVLPTVGSMISNSGFCLAIPKGIMKEHIAILLPVSSGKSKFSFGFPVA